MMIPGKVLHSETQRHVARMSVHDDDHIEDLDLLIRGLIDGGLWDLLLTLNVAGPNASDSLLDLKQNQDSALVGSPAFVADQGFTTVSNTDYIDTQYAFSETHYPVGGLACYPRGNPPIGNMMGAYETPSPPGLTRLIQASSSSMAGHIWGNQSAYFNGTMIEGFRGISRQDAGNMVLCSKLSTATFYKSAAASAPYTHTIFVGTLNSNGSPSATSSPNEYAHWSVTLGLSETLWQAYSALIQAYFTRRGTAV